MPKVSVVVPTYKREAYLYEALLSVKDQSFEDFECLVVNDFPPYKSRIDAVLDRIGDDRFRVIHHQQNGGESQSRNTALKEAKGEIIALLDDDDIWMPDCLEAHVRTHNRNPEAGLVYCGLIQFWDEDLLGAKYVPATPPPAFDELSGEILTGKFCLASSSIVSLKREVFDACGVFDTRLPSFADWDMWLRISQKRPFAYIEKPLIRYRFHLGVRGSTNIEKRLEGISVITEKWSSYPEFHVYKKSLKVDAFFNEIRNQVLHKHYGRAFRLFIDCTFRCAKDLIPNIRLYAFSATLVILGPLYPFLQKMKNPRKASSLQV